MRGPRATGRGEEGRARRRARRRRGFAIFLVILIGIILASFAAILWNKYYEGAPQEEIIVEKRQAYYLAKGAQQHFLLKFKLMPTELYDAVALSIGKNPRYNFSRQFSQAPSTAAIHPDDAKVNPGPLFYFGSVSRIDTSGQVPRIYRTVDLDNPPDGLSAPQIRIHLSQYLLDVATMYPTNDDKGIVVVHSDPHDDKAMGQGWRDPFIGNYLIRDARTIGLRMARKYDEESVLVASVGSVKRAGQISLVSIFDGKPRNLTPVRRMKSDMSFGKHEFPEARTYLENMETFRKRIASDATGKTNVELIRLASGRRTECVTQVYRVAREVQGK